MHHVLQLEGPLDVRNARRGLTARAASRASLALASIASLAPVAQVANSEEAQLEEIIVTGSRIPRPDFESASPIVSVPRQTFERTGSVTVESTLNTLPQFVPSLTSTSNAEGNGQANLNLRGLGAARTLVLVNGMRMIGANGDGVADLNVIPPALIESVEIITGGASAVYGSDAIGGVVNLKLKKEFDGVEVSGRWGQTDRDDGEVYDLSLTAGTPFAEGRGSVIGVLGYSDRGQVDRAARGFARSALAYKGFFPDADEGVTGPGNDFFPVGSGFIEEGRVWLEQGDASEAAFESLFASYGYPAGTVPFQDSFGFNVDRTLFTPGDGTPASVANFRGEIDPAYENGGREYVYNFSPTNALLLPLERTSVFMLGSLAVSDTMEVYAQGLYADYTANAQYAPVPLQNVTMPANNPLIPPDLKRLLDARPDPAAPFEFGRRMTDVGPRVQENQSDTYQVSVGVRGTVLGDWSFDAYVQQGESDQTKRGTNNIRRSKVEELTYAPDGGQSICDGGFDIFGLGSLSAECAAYVSVDSVSTARARETIAEASMRGAVWTLPAGALQTAFGIMYRDASYQFHFDDLLRTFLPDGRPDNAGFLASDNIDGEDHNLDLYAEALVPVLADLPGVHSLEAGFGFRSSDYESAGDAHTWKAELIYQPVERLRLRGSYQRAVRAPGIDELHSPQLPTYVDVVNDPCRVNSAERTGPDSAQVEALCLAQGLPAALLPDFNAPRSYEADGLAGGNPELEPEDGTTYTMGIVFRAPFESRLGSDLQVSLDWYQIEIEDVIEFVDAREFIANCYDPAFNPGYSASNHWCSYFGRSGSSGLIEDTLEIPQNLALMETSGIDLQLNWNLDVGPGELGAVWLVGWIDTFKRQSSPEVAGEEQVGTIGGFAGAYPEWKWNLELSYAVRGLGLSGRWRYIDSMRDEGFPDFEVPHYDYLDLYASYTFDSGVFDGLTVHAGIENLMDEDPPIFPNGPDANTDPSQYDVLGRSYFVSIRYSTF